MRDGRLRDAMTKPMTLLDRVATLLADRNVPHALIGAAALAVHGISRSTLDQDLLVTHPAVLDPLFWILLTPDAVIDARPGDVEDPLAGVVRLRANGERDVDVVVGRDAWQTAVVARAQPVRFGASSIPVVTAADLVLLKLYAGGTQDRWDVEQLMGTDADGQVARQIEERVAALPARCRALWGQLRHA